MSKSIAIVEDQAEILQNYIDLFKSQGYEVNGYDSRETAQSSFEKKLPDLAIIDISLKDEVDGGFDLCRFLRSKSETLPIIFLTARDSDFDIVSGLRLGADDYLTKSASIHHLNARVSALFRRVQAIHGSINHTSTQAIEIDKLSLNLNQLQAFWSGKNLNLTVTEIWILYSLIKNPGNVCSRNYLMKAANTFIDQNTITSHIKRLRNKFVIVDKDFNCIEAIYGAGYRWNISKRHEKKV